ncbi:MAG: hypothetical protein MR958_05460 [Spirochaetia bacterium]|nr:hypothetical protein [Spirochaetia bacterium]MDD7269133.1 hypothetical protein [Treponema sp.]MDY4986258.1 hypothetical protein [Treponema sp.]
MNKVFCPFCHQEVTEDAAPSVCDNALGFSYICYKKICRNKDKHRSNGNIVIPYKSERKRTNTKKISAA